MAILIFVYLGPTGGKIGGFGPNSGLLGQKMSQKSSFSNFDETFHFYPIFHVEYEYET